MANAHLAPRRAGIQPALMKHLKRGLLVMWALVSLGLVCVLIWFEACKRRSCNARVWLTLCCAALPMNFGVTAHDGSVVLNNGALVIVVGPVNNTLVKPQTGILM